MMCQQCKARSARPVCGAYNFGCVECCASLVQSAHPSKHMARVMLAAIGRFSGAPSRQAVLNCVARRMAKLL